MRLEDWFDHGAMARGRAYAAQRLVLAVSEAGPGLVVARVSNGRGKSYAQRVTLAGDFLDGVCSCPVGHNCKHVVAALTVWQQEQEAKPDTPSLARPVAGWLARVRESAEAPALVEDPRPADYPAAVKDRLLYVLVADGPRLRVETYKGRINAAGTGLNKTIRRYDAGHALRSAAPARFLRPLDLELLQTLAQAGLWNANYSYGLPELLRPSGEQVLTLIQRLCETGRLFHDNAPEAQLVWSSARPEVYLSWHVDQRGHQRLGFADADGQALTLFAVSEAGLWLDTARGEVGALETLLPEEVLRLTASSPPVSPAEAPALAEALPQTLGGLALPRPGAMRAVRRKAKARHARLILGGESARDGPRWYGTALRLPTLTLRFVYDGHEHPQDGTLSRVEGTEIVTIARDPVWEATCADRLLAAGAVPTEDLEHHWPSDRMIACDYVFADGEMLPENFEMSRQAAALPFAFRTVPSLRAEGWEVIETGTWPYRLSAAEVSLAVATGTAGQGAGFAGNDWFSLGFQAEIDGKPQDLAPLIAETLAQIRLDWEAVPDQEMLARHLSESPIYLEQGKAGYVPLDLSPLAPVLHLFLMHMAEMGVLHPTDAGTARLVEEALAGTDVRFADHAGILPLARTLEALGQGAPFEPPAGFGAALRDYQAHGTAWMVGVLAAGFGAVLADDMGLGKTVQTLALLATRRAVGAAGPALLILPTSLLHSWQTQAARFAPDLTLVTLHGSDRAGRRDAALEADLVLTTYPLLARDREWLAAQDWPLVILDEAQTLKNPAAQMAKALREIPAQGRLALTGTPLENSLQDIWTLIDWVNPGLLGDRKTFQTQFRGPIEKDGDPAAQARLNRRLRPFLLRRTKEEVAAELPPKTEILERVDLPKSQQALYETVRSSMDARVRAAIETKGLAGARITVLDALLKLRQVCCDPALVKTEAARAVTDSAKRARLRDLLAQLVAEGRRVLVFSQFVEMLRLIEADLEAAAIPTLVLTGQTRDRAAVLENFATGTAPVFLLSLKAGGVGLTLTQADTVILYDPWWNPAVERQAMDRTHRIGQDKPVFVHRLVAAGTVEEKILDMQARKQALADALFETASNSGSPLLDAATLQDLFAPL